MSDEVPLTISKTRKRNYEGELRCIMHYDRNKNDKDVRSLSEAGFNKIRKSVQIRQSTSDAATRLDEICLAVPSQYDAATQGTHHWCYSNFNNVARIEQGLSTTELAGEVDSQAVRTSSRKPSGASNTALFSKTECLFCEKHHLRRKGELEGLIKCVTLCAENNIKECAKIKQDFSLLGKIEGVDLRAREAMYHESCRRRYVKKACSEDVEVDDEREETELGWKNQIDAYRQAFQYLSTHVRNEIIQSGTVERMAMLKERYLGYIKLHTPQFYNPDYPTQKLKDKLRSHFGEELQFWQPNYRSELVYSSLLQTGEVVESAFEAAASESRILQDAALVLRRHILDAQLRSPAMPWPPSASHLKSDAVAPPDSLKEFLSFLISGKAAAKASKKTDMLTLSFTEDLCSAATRGHWKMPKHLLLGITLHHKTGSAEIITMLNRFGHCQSYSQVLELETAMANQAILQNNILPSNIRPAVECKVVHLCWDNFDLNEETPTGSGTTHSTHGIMIQEVFEGVTSETEIVTVVPVSKQRSVKYTMPEIPPYMGKKKADPVLEITAMSSDDETPCKIAVMEAAWTLCRALHNQSCTVPQWAGWLSKIAVSSEKVPQSVIGYMQPIFGPITEYSTVQECLVTSIKASRILSQPYTFVTMDLAAAKIAYDIQWENADKFGNVIINLGAFHIMCSFMGALGKMMTGSGFEDLVIEAGVCASGSIEKVMSGKHYNRALRVHQLMSEALERLLVQACFNESTNQSAGQLMSTSLLSKLAENPSSEALHAFDESSEGLNLMEQFSSFKDEVRRGLFGNTARFWLSYCDCVWLLKRFLQAIKQNNMALYVDCLRKLCCLMFSSDHIHYARYMPLYYTQLRNLPISHPGANELLCNSGFSVSRSDIPCSRNPIDLTIEQTINKSAKTAGGVIGFSRKPSAYYRWCVTRYNRAMYADAAMDRIDMVHEPTDLHKACRPSQIRRSESDVILLLDAIKLHINPFDIEESKRNSLFCLSSGKPATEKVQQDLLMYVEMGDAAAEEFIQARFVTKTTKFHEPLKKLNLQTFKSMASSRTVTTSQKKVVQVKAERNLLGRLLFMSQEHNIDLEKLFKYPLSPVPWSLATADGGLVKTNKAELMHHLERWAIPADQPPLDKSVYVIDGNAHYQSLVRLPETFEELCLQIFLTLPKACIVHFVTDTYHANSIKSAERARRGSSEELLLGGPKTKLPRDWKGFLHNSENKKQLNRLLLSEWQTDKYSKYLGDRKVFVVCEEECVCITADCGRIVATRTHSLCSSQEKADTRIILHCLHATQSTTDDKIVIVRSPDTDVFILLLFYSVNLKRTLFFDTGTSNNRRLLDIQRIADALGCQMVRALPALHAFTGSDCVSAFVRKGKVTPFKTLERHPQFFNIFETAGSADTAVTDEMMDGTQQFVCCLYGKPAYTSVNKLRYDMFRARYEFKSPSRAFVMPDGIDLSLIPPCKSSLRMHLRRTCYQAYIWKHAHEPLQRIPSPIGCGWTIIEDELSIDWIEGDVMPQQVLDVMASSDAEPLQSYGNDDYEKECEVEEDCEVDNVLDVIFDDDDEPDDDC